MYIASREGLQFDTKDFLNNILGQANKSKGFLNKHDYSVSSNKNELNTNRKSKNYNSFGETRKINF